ncbi:MAG: hypothetical protein KAU94_03755 [Verrucomicrobia bacterium]|nr:hypothetical protein [Verrucomicrobiota bacterium]
MGKTIIILLASMVAGVSLESSAASNCARHPYLMKAIYQRDLSDSEKDEERLNGNGWPFDHHHDFGILVENADTDPLAECEFTIGLFADSFSEAAVGFLNYLGSGFDDMVGWVDATVKPSNESRGYVLEVEIIDATDYGNWRAQLDPGKGSTLLLGPKPDGYHLALQMCQQYAATQFNSIFPVKVHQ